MKYQTKELNFAAYLWTLPNVSLINAALLSGSGSVFFIFEVPVETEEEMFAIQRDYYNGSTRVEPKSYANKQADLRDLVHARLGIDRKSNKGVSNVSGNSKSG